MEEATQELGRKLTLEETMDLVWDELEYRQECIDFARKREKQGNFYQKAELHKAVNDAIVYYNAAAKFYKELKKQKENQAWARILSSENMQRVVNHINA